MTRILVVNGSYREDGFTDQAVGAAADGDKAATVTFEDTGTSVEKLVSATTKVGLSLQGP